MEFTQSISTGNTAPDSLTVSHAGDYFVDLGNSVTTPTNVLTQAQVVMGRLSKKDKFWR